VQVLLESVKDMMPVILEDVLYRAYQADLMQQSGLTWRAEHALALATHLGQAARLPAVAQARHTAQ
jgi:hypothetical protein